MEDFDCMTLPPGRMRDICQGTSGLPETGPGNTRESYIRHWKKQPPLPPADTSCTHRGGHVGWAACDTCPRVEEKAKVRLKVFHCPLHAECTVGPSGTIWNCLTCGDRVSSVASS